MSIAGRPDPDALLEAIRPKAEGRGRLKIFLGASAGVGKTYAMLSEAHEQKERGIDVVIGYVETHGRSETSRLTTGLETVPMLELRYRETVLQEVHVAAILERNPELVLIDELAHSNAEGSIHRKRWQDVDDILAAGINVYSAVNIQHLESLNDVVAQVTGVRVQETVPDAFIEAADEIELIDIPPAELRQRLTEGKVYVSERIESALEGFFKTSNLTALRELALRRTADTVDAEVQRLRTQQGGIQAWATRERILVCVAPNRMAARVVRSAARLGAASHAEMIAVYVESDRQASRPIEQQNAAQEGLDLARQLGMEVVTLTGHDIVTEIFQYARRRNATLVVVGKPIRARWKEILFGSVVDEMVRHSGDIDVHVITGDEDAKPRLQLQARNGLGLSPLGVIQTMIGVALATGFGALLFDQFGPANIAMVYVLVVAVLSLRCSRSESAFAALLCVLGFNFFFVEPRLTFAITDLRYLVLFAVMLMVALVISTLTHRLKEQLMESSQRERRTQSLYRLSQQLARQRSKKDLAEVAAKEVRETFDGEVTIALLDRSQLNFMVGSASGFEKRPSEHAVAAWVASHGQEAGFETETLPGAAALYLPLKGAESQVGVLGFLPQGGFGSLGKRQLLETFANSLGLALERAILAKESNDSRVQAEAERIRSTLLSSISHDLRTPLTSITGAASSLISHSGDQDDLARTIYTESLRLNQQIQNLLDMTRLQSGELSLHREWQSASDLVSSAVMHAKPSLGEREITAEVQADLPLLYVDGLLIEKALINLLENVGRHAGEGSPAKVEAVQRSGSILFTISDRGPGLPQTELDELFRPGAKTRSGGYGLGLAVVKAVMDLHGGDVYAEGNPGGGASIGLRLPLPDHQPETPLD